ncbi:hypothetical protein METBIDRAFT_9747 [Metschnikowia bicuspidata var. bicuspidata NRRL YB-4993]|uniref:Uncharacterized protein n=1 Tax=Metschnikowia bicuspidata var. bicuspidata NRRL YB-4993 TaxID=869754 RepID=A0A1A0HI19_9ASCO|nr:hypothetical protein METBIDRAFT_9747 [Metschnikowia bicuspidata var. bicuspidata NRRL YB-4993]OBA23488.1 hypothetical protein METBIDRAFT_9747 [Metschnikowia bicuspidata var. bicuspidata NRRL YB-4993]
MALQLKKNRFRLSTVTTGALVIGAGVLLFKTFPHLKTSLLSRFSEETAEEEDGNDVVQLNEEKAASEDETTESLIQTNKIPADASKWCDATLKSYLTEVSIPFTHTTCVLRLQTRLALVTAQIFEFVKL